MAETRKQSPRASRKFNWLKQVAADLGRCVALNEKGNPVEVKLTGLDTRLAVMFAVPWVSDDDLTGWRPQQLLAEDLGVTVTAVKASIFRLRSRGHLRIVSKGGGRKHASCYQLVLKPEETVNDGLPNGDEKRSTENDPSCFVNGQPPTTVSRRKRSTAVSETVNGDVQKRSTALDPNTVYESSVELRGDIYTPPPAPKPAKPKAKVEDDRFQAFWSAYPKKVAKADAVKAWGKALKAADADTLIAGAMRYAAEQHGKDPTYTKHPATWLNKGCWTDEPAPPRPPSPPAPGGGLTAKDRTRAVVRHLLDSVETADGGEAA